jgi:pantoate--beta-alanine ligase
LKVVRRAGELREMLEPSRAKGSVIGFVPTMGALHEGHLSLVQRAREECDLVVASVYVNPLQFVEGEDFEEYPRDTEGDLELLEGEGADITFLPANEEMYPDASPTTTRISVGRLGEVYEGADRPGHFDGVCTIVAKLFHMVGPTRAYFGRKDAQQTAVLKRMVRDLNFDIELIVCPIVREATGLAMSSRNAYLSETERARAVALSRSLRAGERALKETADIGAAERAMAEMLDSTEGVTRNYARVVHPDTFEPALMGDPSLLIVAARVGPARLIDNLLVEPK